MRASIVALDLSLTGTGWATLDPDGVVSTGRITTRLTGCQRIDYVLDEVTRLCDARLVVIEGPALTENLAYFHENAAACGRSRRAWRARLRQRRGRVMHVLNLIGQVSGDLLVPVVGLSFIVMVVSTARKNHRRYDK